MEEPDYYFTIEGPVTAETKDRGSRFIAHAFPLESAGEFKIRRNEIKKANPKATHHCFAYRLGWDDNDFRVSDDGEPSGSAGRPILGQIDSKSLINTGIVVTRYFGGTMLGVPGLIHAYKSAAALALQTTPILRLPVEKTLTLEFDYTQVNAVMMIIKVVGGKLLRQELQLYCRLSVAIPKNRLEEFTYRLAEIRNLEMNPTIQPAKGAD